jgi:xylonate dehydratase
VRLNTAVGGSTNAPPHLIAIARHTGVEFNIEDWQTYGYELPLLVNMQPAGKYLGEAFFRAGAVPAVMAELLKHGMLDGNPLTVSGKSVAENLQAVEIADADVIRSCDSPLKHNAGFAVLSGNLFDSALMKTSVISDDFRQRYLSTPGNENVFDARAIVFEGPEDYHERLNDPALGIDEHCMLFIRGVGPVGYPGSAEVVNMQPPDHLLNQGITHLPTAGDGRQSGTSESPSILNASPESVVGGGLAILETGDPVQLDLNRRELNLMLPEQEIARRREAWTPPELDNQTPWQELYRNHVGQLGQGGCLEFATCYRQTSRVLPRDNH